MDAVTSFPIVERADICQLYAEALQSSLQGDGLQPFMDLIERGVIPLPSEPELAQGGQGVKRGLKLALDTVPTGVLPESFVLPAGNQRGWLVVDEVPQCMVSIDSASQPSPQQPSVDPAPQQELTEEPSVETNESSQQIAEFPPDEGQQLGPEPALGPHPQPDLFEPPEPEMQPIEVPE